MVLANAGHSPTEIDVTALEDATVENIPVGDALSRHVRVDGTYVDLISNGRMMNLTGPYPKGNSIESMDLGFAMQARSIERIALHHVDLLNGAQPVPDDINRQLARAFVEAMQR